MTQSSKQEKLLAAKRYHNESICYREFAEQLVIDHSVLRFWVTLVKHHGDQAFAFLY